MNFNLSREDNEVIVTITTGRGGFEFLHTFQNKPVAGWIYDAIVRGVEKRIKQIREKAYKQGRRSTYNKDAVCTEFNGCINEHEVGWK